MDIGKVMSMNPAESIRTAMAYTHLGKLLTSTVTNTGGHNVHRAGTWCSWINVPYFRLNPPISQSMPLNETDDVEIVNALWETKAYMRAISSQLDAIVDLLKVIQQRSFNFDENSDSTSSSTSSSDSFSARENQVNEERQTGTVLAAINDDKSLYDTTVNIVK